MSKYPIGIQDFSEIRKSDFLYIDKTRTIFNLIDSGKYYFLSRPRRFGKSLLLSTIKYLFGGEKKLFKGLWIENKYDFPSHPVLHFSFSTLGYKSIGLENGLLQMLDTHASRLGIQLDRNGVGPRFEELIHKLKEKEGKVVLLIDEYDKPLVDYIENSEQAEENREILKNFFSIIKDADPYLQFFLITGVSKFSKVSLFSDLNHLRDITLLEAFGDIAGYTQKELDHYFKKDIEALATKKSQTTSEIREEIKKWYNGYTWDNTTRLYNPFSILNFFASRQFRNFWWETGTPTFLIKILRKNFYFNLEEIEAGSTLFESYTLENLEWRSLLFQTGYLTIVDYDPEFEVYTLGYPNREVKDSMFQHLLSAFREDSHTTAKPLYSRIKKSLDAYDIPRLIGLIDTLFSTIPHQIFIEKQEAFFHAVLHLTFQGLGLWTQSEVSTSKGRVDTIIYSKSHIYIMEFKLDASAEEALQQIREKRYGSSYLNQGLEVIALGVSFSSETRTVADWKVIPYEELLIEG